MTTGTVLIISGRVPDTTRTVFNDILFLYVKHILSFFQFGGLISERHPHSTFDAFHLMEGSVFISIFLVTSNFTHPSHRIFRSFG